VSQLKLLQLADVHGQISKHEQCDTTRYKNIQVKTRNKRFCIQHMCPTTQGHSIDSILCSRMLCKTQVILKLFYGNISCTWQLKACCSSGVSNCQRQAGPFMPLGTSRLACASAIHCEVVGKALLQVKQPQACEQGKGMCLQGCTPNNNMLCLLQSF
jgi:hypothetical protein